jgi:hypothetical protein
MRRHFAPLILIIHFAGSAYSQSGSSSPYSVYGIGMLNDKSAALNRSNGGLGIAIRDITNLNNYNPAAYTSIQGATQLFEIGLYTESNNYQTKDESGKFNSGNLSGINAWFRFSNKWAGVVGLSPFSKVDYSIASSRRIGLDDGSAVTYSGSGGITQFYIGNAFQISRNLSVGVDGSFIFGTIERSETITSGRGTGTVLKNSVYTNGFKADFGAQYSFFLANNRSINLGVTYAPELQLNTTGKRMLINTLEDDTTAFENSSMDDYILPYSAAAGVSYQTTTSTIAFDFVYKAWSDAFIGDNIELKNTSRFALGYSYQGNPNGEHYRDFIQYRLGVHMQSNYLILNSTSFNDWGLSAGIGLPVSGNRGTISLSYHYNQSGTLQNYLIKQHTNTIVLDFIFRDRWGIKKRYD